MAEIEQLTLRDKTLIQAFANLKLEMMAMDFKDETQIGRIYVVTTEEAEKMRSAARA